ncbi:MAG: hypothetical protein R2712_07230 [Vicinamibacterales bacterium]
MARLRAIDALRRFPVLGLRTNIPFLIRLLEHPQFVGARIDTGFLDRDGGDLRTGGATEPPAPALAVAAMHGRRPRSRANAPGRRQRRRIPSSHWRTGEADVHAR